MPFGIQNLCQSSGFDRFVFYKPIGFDPSNLGTTMWYINGVGQAPGDSMAFIPTSVGEFIIHASWGGNHEYSTLNLYSVSPPNAIFQVFSGGSINLGNDTISMCGITIDVAATGLSGSDATYMQWIGPSFNSLNNNPVTISTPGTYYFERGNPCGVTRDTFQLVALPFVLPVFTDTALCNSPNPITLDPGPGWTYSWSTGETTQTIDVDSTYIYTVNLSNVCISGNVSIDVEYQSFPLPDMSYLPLDVLCADSVVVMQPDQGGYLYNTYAWSNGANTPTISISGLSGGAGYYSVTVTQGGCSATTGWNLQFYSTPNTPEICIVTSDPVLNKNIVVFTNQGEPPLGDPFYSAVDHYNIYKWVSGVLYDSIGTVPVALEHTFVDVTSNPPSTQATYKISMVDACGVEGPKSFFHTTILLQSSLGSLPGSINLAWDPYVDESGNFTVTTYDIYRGPHPDSLTFLVSTGFLSYVDFGVTGQVYYQIVAIRPGGCNSTPAFMKNGSNNKAMTMGSFSNITDLLITSVPVLTDMFPVNIYPNPSSTGIFQVDGEQISRVEVMDILGHVLFTTTKTIDLSAYAKGIYNARIISTMGSTSYKKIVVQ